MMSQLTKARARCLKKAEAGRIFMEGGFGGSLKGREAISRDDFDRKQIIEFLLNDGLLTWGDASNTYVITERGRAALAAFRDHEAARAEKKRLAAEGRVEKAGTRRRHGSRQTHREVRVA